MKNKTTLLFGIHMHQPIDNFAWVIERAVEVCYAPFFDVMSKYPKFHFSLHCSGWLMQQIKESYPKLYKQIQILSKKGSIEIFSAGYYEPILSAIPSSDRVAQVQKLNDTIKFEFKQHPKGVWLTERVWESSLIPDLHRAGMQYTVIDDYHFQCAGFNEDVLDGYYMTEEGGEKLGLFPISKKLRYALPFLEVESAIETIKLYNKKSDSAAIIFDDAEKFGMWPGTHEWVYKKGWLEKFVQGVLADELIETSHYSSYYEQQLTRGIAYLPNVSYYEMGEWSLNADDALKLESLKKEMGAKDYEEFGVKFLKGGIWKNFFLKYGESNRIHKRMIELSKVRESVKNIDFDDKLYRLQTNDTFWHGIFGGLYLPNLRDNAYKYLIECENLRYPQKNILIVSDQNELDGCDKVKIVTPEFIFRFDGANGGQLVEFDSRLDSFNWQNTLTRRKEAYHQWILDNKPAQEIAIEENGIDTIHNAAMDIDETLRDFIIYDWHLKNSFIDHISDKSFTYESFVHCNFFEYGDFANQPFEVFYDKNSVTFFRQGGFYFPQKEKANLVKIYNPKLNGIDFEINLSSEVSNNLQYIMEHNFHFANYETIKINGELMQEKGIYKQIQTLEIYDSYLKKNIIISLNQKFDLYYFPLKTLSQSDEGFDLTIQSISFAMIIPFEKELTIQGSLEVEYV